jgi:hypothetical protein
MLVNALVTGLIVFGISKVFWEVKAISDRRVLCGTGWTKSVIFLMVESEAALLSIQLVRLVVTVVLTTPPPLRPLYLLVVCNTCLL